MSTIIRVSVGGPLRNELRRAIRHAMIAKGMTTRPRAEFAYAGQLSPNEAQAIINTIYDQETKFPGSRVRTLTIQSRLVTVEMRRDLYSTI